MNAVGWIALAIAGAAAIVAIVLAWRLGVLWEAARRDLVKASGDLALEQLGARAAAREHEAAQQRWAIDEDVLADRLARETARTDRARLARDRVVAAAATERSRLLRELADMGEAVQTVARREEQAREDAALAVGLALTRLAAVEEQLTGYEAAIEEADRIATDLSAAYAQEVGRHRITRRMLESHLAGEPDAEVVPITKAAGR